MANFNDDFVVRSHESFDGVLVGHRPHVSTIHLPAHTDNGSIIIPSFIHF